MSQEDREEALAQGFVGCIYLILLLGFWGGVLYIAFHFLMKVW